MSPFKSSKMLQFINYRMRVTVQDGRELVGKFIVFDRRMNLVLGDCEDYPNLPYPIKRGRKKNNEIEECRTLGLVLLRGEDVISMTDEGPPPPEAVSSAISVPGPGIGRRVPTALFVQTQPGLAGPVHGVVGLAPGATMNSSDYLILFDFEILPLYL